MRANKHVLVMSLLIVPWFVSTAGAQEGEQPTSQPVPTSQPYAPTASPAPDASPLPPALPEGMSLEETLEQGRATPESFPDVIHDDQWLGLLMVDWWDYRLSPADVEHATAWEINAWFGGDYNRLVFKPEGEYEASKLKTENDLVYSRLIAPFWSAQAGASYSNSWSSEEGYTDTWALTLGFQGIAPGKFEVDVAAYLSQNADVTLGAEVEYDWRLTQRLVFQPRVAVSLAAQDIPSQGIGAGLSSLSTAARLRYEFLRELAPYIGVRWERDFFGTAQRTRQAGESPGNFSLLAGLRFAFL